MEQAGIPSIVIAVATLIAASTPIILAGMAYYQRKDAQIKNDKLDGIHTLVNDQMTTEKQHRLDDLRAQRLVLTSIMGDDITNEHKQLLLSMEAKIEQLKAEITQRDVVAQDVVSFPK